MIDLYTVPLGATARDFFAAEAEKIIAMMKLCWCFPAGCL